LDPIVGSFLSAWESVWFIFEFEAINAKRDQQWLRQHFRSAPFQQSYTLEDRIFLACIWAQGPFTLAARKLGKGLVRWDGSDQAVDFGLRDFCRDKLDENGSLTEYFQEALEADFRAGVVTLRHKFER
jgi:hypothetical protein